MKRSIHISRFFALCVILFLNVANGNVFGWSLNKIDNNYSMFLYSFLAGGNGNIITEPAIVGSCANGLNVGLISGTDISGATYSWEYSIDYGTTPWKKVSSTATGKDLTPGLRYQVTWYRRVATVNGVSSESNIVKIYATMTSGISGSNTITINGKQEGFTAEGVTPPMIDGTVIKTNGKQETAEDYNYKWELSEDGGTTWKTIEGAKESSYQPNPIFKETKYRRSVRFWECEYKQASAWVTIKIAEPKIENNMIIQPTGNETCNVPSIEPGLIVGTDAVVVGVNDPIIYSWIVSDNGVDWSPVTSSDGYSADATGNRKDNGTCFKPSTIRASRSFKRKVNSGTLEDVTVFPVNFVVAPNGLTNNTIISGPTTVIKNQASGETIVGSVVEPVLANVSYLWEQKTTSNWSNAVTGSSNVAKDLVLPVLQETTTYRRKASTSLCSEIISSEWTVTVEEPGLIGNNKITPPSETKFCGMAEPGLIVGSDATNAIGYRWEENKSDVQDDDTQFKPINGATNRDYKPGIIDNNISYRRIAISQDDTEFPSNIVYFEATPSEIVGNIIISEEGSVFPLGEIIASTPMGGNNIEYYYEWQQSDDGMKDWRKAEGVSDEKNYTVGSLRRDTFFRRVITSGNCISITDNFLVSTVPYYHVYFDSASWLPYKGDEKDLSSSADVQYNVKNESTKGISGLRIEVETEAAGVFPAITCDGCGNNLKTEVNDNNGLPRAMIWATTPDLQYWETLPVISAYFLPAPGVKDFDITATVYIHQEQSSTEKVQSTVSVRNFKAFTKIDNIPNLITPNGDGKNDYFVIPNIDGYAIRELTMFDRWGTKVYFSDKYDNTWDASGLADGTFYYILKLSKDVGVQPDLKKGFVTVMRSSIKD